VVCAWGNHGAHRSRSLDVISLLRDADVRLHALKVTGIGEPCHPLYLPASLKPVKFGA